MWTFKVVILPSRVILSIEGTDFTLTDTGRLAIEDNGDIIAVVSSWEHFTRTPK